MIISIEDVPKLSDEKLIEITENQWDYPKLLVKAAGDELDRRGIKIDEKGSENNVTQQMTKKEFNGNAQYDPKIIYEFAARLYSKANTVITIYTIIGALIGGILGYGVKRGGGLLFGLVVFGFIGFYLGREKAFWLKLQAQTSLCQAKIEKNTRKQ
jgi:hypothetical protein